MKKANLKQYAKLLYEITETSRDYQKALADFVRLLEKKRLIYKVENIIAEYEKYYNQEKGITKIKVVTAKKIERALLGKLRKLGKKIEIEESVDEEILGGARFEIEGKIIDGSIRGGLNRLNLYIKKS
jgi:F-type H+-transporting ATPase subunit delta